MATTLVDNVVRLVASGDAYGGPLTNGLNVRGILIRSTASAADVTITDNRSTPRTLFVVGVGANATGGNGFFMAFGGVSGQAFSSGLRLATASAEVDIFLA